MKKHYLHLSVYRCDKCQGPVVNGSLAVRENEISKETEKQHIGASCLSCGYRHKVMPEGTPARHFLPVDWPPVAGVNASRVTTAFVEALNRAELH
jgi:DNA-directed RNA polymerase subunit RPC12/RpoP